MLIETNQYVETTLATYIFLSIMVARASDDPVERRDDGIVWHGLKQEDPISILLTDVPLSFRLSGFPEQVHVILISNRNCKPGK